MKLFIHIFILHCILSIQLGKCFEGTNQKWPKKFIFKCFCKVNQLQPTWDRGPICHHCFPSSLFHAAQGHLLVIFHLPSLLWFCVRLSFLGCVSLCCFLLFETSWREVPFYMLLVLDDDVSNISDSGLHEKLIFVFPRNFQQNECFKECEKGFECRSSFISKHVTWTLCHLVCHLFQRRFYLFKSRCTVIQTFQVFFWTNYCGGPRRSKIHRVLALTWPGKPFPCIFKCLLSGRDSFLTVGWQHWYGLVLVRSGWLMVIHGFKFPWWLFTASVRLRLSRKMTNLLFLLSLLGLILRPGVTGPPLCFFSTPKSEEKTCFGHFWYFDLREAVE